jgi:CPA1 family monovalent cation:H+ antiporter
MDIVVFALSAVAIALALVALAVPLAQRIGLPLPVAIAGAGLLAGTAAALNDITLARTTLAVYDRWFVEQVAFDSSALLYIFLPPLLFEMALAVNVRRMLDDIGGVIVLAVIAVVAATLLVGLAVWLITPIGLVACLMLGAAVATTDPAAVITTFREIGAPKRLLVILEGESLLNDAAAIAIFTFLLALSGPEASPTVTGVIFGFLYSFIAGAGFGLCLSYAASRVYPLLGRSSMAEASMTVAVAYGAYLAADQWLGASGVVAVVFAGLATGQFGFVRMGPGNWDTVRIVWSQVGFWANTLILMLVSLLAPWMLLSLTWMQAGVVAVVYLAAFAARAFILFGALPLLERTGRALPMDRPQRVLVFWGGVRGAVTLILAISLTETPTLGGDGPVLGALAAAPGGSGAARAHRRRVDRAGAQRHPGYRRRPDPRAGSAGRRREGTGPPAPRGRGESRGGEQTDPLRRAAAPGPGNTLGSGGAADPPGLRGGRNRPAGDQPASPHRQPHCRCGPRRRPRWLCRGIGGGAGRGCRASSGDAHPTLPPLGPATARSDRATAHRAAGG